LLLAVAFLCSLFLAEVADQQSAPTVSASKVVAAPTKNAGSQKHENGALIAALVSLVFPIVLSIVAIIYAVIACYTRKGHKRVYLKSFFAIFIGLITLVVPVVLILQFTCPGADLQTDVEHCGTCMNRCDLPHAYPRCVNGTCAIDSCYSGYSDFNSDASDGCESSIYSARFIAGQSLSPTSTQCVSWNNFRNGLSADVSYNIVKFTGSLNSTGMSCTGTQANTICQALREGASQTVTCDGHTWQVVSGSVSCGVNDVGIAVDQEACMCASYYALLPCVSNKNWGGIGYPQCPPTQDQTLSVSCLSAAP